MKCGIIYLVTAIVIVAGIILAATPLRTRIHEVATNLKTIRGDTDDVMAGASLTFVT